MRETLGAHGITPSEDTVPSLPDLHSDDLFYWEAFQDLSSDRRSGDVPGPILWTAKRAYAMDAGLDEDQTQEFYTIIGIMDKEFVAYYHRLYEQRMKQAEQKAKQRRARRH